QRQAQGPISPLHRRLFVGAIYLPMAAAIFLYGHLVPENYEGEPYYPINLGADVSWGLGLIAVGWVVAYLIWTSRQIKSEYRQAHEIQTLHPAERWVVLAHAVAFGSACVLGATNSSFFLRHAVHDEVQCLYFAYGMARRSMPSRNRGNFAGNPQAEVRLAASFAIGGLICHEVAVSHSW